MSTPPFQRIGVIPNLDKEGVRAILNSFVPNLISAGFAVAVEDKTLPHLRDTDGVEVGISRNCDLLAAIGGDGTMLMVARRYLEWGLPILGVKGGRLGFLTEHRGEGKGISLGLRQGHYRVQERMRITAAVVQRDEIIKEFSALNDVVVHVAGSSRIARIRTQLNGTLIREYSADGVIVATPTGSTAYSLSAGGPVLWPTMKAIILTPLAPHTLSVRPLVLGAEGEVTIELLTPDAQMRVTVDGQKGTDLEPGQRVAIRQCPLGTKLLVSNDYDFFSLLREKL